MGNKFNPDEIAPQAKPTIQSNINFLSDNNNRLYVLLQNLSMTLSVLEGDKAEGDDGEHHVVAPVGQVEVMLTLLDDQSITISRLVELAQRIDRALS